MKKILLGLCFLLVGRVDAFDIPEYTGYVNDVAGVLSVQQESKLTEQIKGLEESTTVEIAVLVIGTTDGVDIQEYGTMVAEKWGVGKADVDNGVLITVAVLDRAWRIDTGYGVEGILPDIQTARIAERNFLPYFRQGDYFTGLSRGVSDMNGLLVQDPSVVSTYEETQFNAGEDLIVVGSIILFILGMITAVLSKSKNKRSVGVIVVIAIGVGILFVLLMQAVIGLFSLLMAYLYGFGVGIGNGSNGGVNRFTGGFGSSSGGFGGFGGGSFGGGGSSGRW